MDILRILFVLAVRVRVFSTEIMDYIEVKVTWYKS